MTFTETTPGKKNVKLDLHMTSVENGLKYNEAPQDVDLVEP